jgi:uncharacterized protein
MKPLEGARHIVAEWISENADLRKALRQIVFDEGVVVSQKLVDAADEQQKFRMYYEYREPVKSIPSHRMLAIRRGESEKVLYFLIELERQRPLAVIQKHTQLLSERLSYRWIERQSGKPECHEW